LVLIINRSKIGVKICVLQSFLMLVLPRKLDPKNFARENKVVLFLWGYFFLLEVFFFGGYYYSSRKLLKPEPLKPFLGVMVREATVAAEVASAEAEAKTEESPIVNENVAAVPPPPPAPPKPHSSTFSTFGTPNNKFGMYINADPSQIAEVAPLINSHGGAWGWVLVPMDIRQKDAGLWQSVLDACRAHHLKPLLQLFNNQTCDVHEMDFAGLAEFLNQLSWPTKHLYISVFNEVNAKDYWCEKLAPEEYAVVLNAAIEAFKAVNPNFFVMPAGFNSSCRSGPRYLDEEDFLVRMNATVPGIFQKIDGWATHAYPQPEFSGDFYHPPSWYGVRDQIENYKWERSLLQKYFGVTNLPIFITETGWAHVEGNSPLTKLQAANYQSATVTARYFDDAYRNHWLPENQIVAIMPFVWYKSDALHFNWKKDDGTFYPQYDVVMNFPKVAGTDD